MKNVAIVVLVLVLAGVGYWVFTKEAESPVMENGTRTETNTPSTNTHNTTGAEQDMVRIISGELVGTYQGNPNTKFTREFKADGTVVDTYEGKVVAEGTWQVYTKESPLPVAFDIAEKASYVQITFAGAQSQTLNFRISEVTPAVLNLVFMERGGTLSFNRI